jgi:hypothetical protein
MSDSQIYLEDARKCFALAAQAKDIVAMERFVEMGRAYLALAHEHAAVAFCQPGRKQNG